MAYGTKTCRVCGKEYKACVSPKRKEYTFRWQAVSCSPECGSIYLEELIKSRSTIEESRTLGHETIDILELYIPDFDDEDEFDEDLDLEDEE